MFQIEGSENSPWVLIDGNTGIINIIGSSTFQKPFFFYKGIARWIHAFNKQGNKTRVVNIKIIDMDEASVKCMILIFRQLEDLNEDNVIVNWYYKQQDIQLHSIGKKYSSSLKLNFNLIAA